MVEPLEEWPELGLSKEEKSLDIGAIVKINKSSEHFGQSNLWGKVVNDEGGSWYHVHFCGGYSNCYRPKDLDILKEGDMIIINENGNSCYNHSKQGSEGVIQKFEKDGRLEVRFSKLTGEGSPVCPKVYGEISPVHVDLIKGDDLKEKAQRKAEKKQKEKEQLDGQLAELHSALCSWLPSEG